LEDREQKEKSGDQNGAVEVALKVGIREKAQLGEMRGILAGPVEPRGQRGPDDHRSEQIGENLKGNAQEEKELAWTRGRRKLKFSVMHNRHAWIVRTADRVKREVRVIKSDGSWRFQAKRQDEGHWNYYDEPPLEDLEEFREILFRKYQRRRASYEDVQWAEHELIRRRERLRDLGG
jgi:hypothetical protein